MLPAIQIVFKIMRNSQIINSCMSRPIILSLGISMLEIMSEVELPNNGHVWHSLRNGDLPPTPGNIL